MKEPTRYRILVPLVLFATAQAVVQAQSDPFGGGDASPFAPQDVAGDFTRADVADAASAEAMLLNEIAAIEAATASRRQQIEQQLQDLQRARVQREKQMAEMAKRGAQPPAFSEVLFEAPEVRWFIGVRVDPAAQDGVHVQHLVPDMPASRAGIEVGDVIQSVNDIRVKDVGALNAIINAAGDQELSFQIRRGDAELKKAITPVHQVPAQQSGPRVPVPLESARGEFFGSDHPGAFHFVPVPQPPQVAAPTVREWTYSPRANANPDTAELTELKREIADLRGLVQEVVEVLSEEDDALEGHAEDAAEDADGESD